MDAMLVLTLFLAGSERFSFWRLIAQLPLPQSRKQSKVATAGKRRQPVKRSTRNDMHGMIQTEADDGYCKGETQTFRGIDTPVIKSAGVVIQ